jgi:Antirepressor regulating drug resistance, predicted signal transduction N-terminal membrane component
MILRSFFITIFAMIYAVICPYLRKKYNSTALYRVWIILMMCYIIPSIPMKFDKVTNIPVLSVTANFIRGTEEYVANDNIISRFPTAQLVDIPAILTVIWIIGIIFLIVKNLKAHYKFVNLLKIFSDFEFFTDDGIIVMSNPYVDTPLLYGFIIPRIVIPKKVMKSDALPMIIEHETIHYRRHDLFIKLILMIIAILHWFNPFVRYLIYAVNTQCEMSCDAEVVKNKDKNLCYNYGEAIIRIATVNDNMVESHATAFSNGKKYIKSRLVNIIENRQHSKKSKPLILMSIFILLFCVFLLSSANAEKPVEFGSLTMNIPSYWNTEINQYGIMTIHCGPVLIGEVCVMDGKNITYNDYFYNRLTVRNSRTGVATTLTNQVITYENLSMLDQHSFVFTDTFNKCYYIIYLSTTFFSQNDVSNLIDNASLHS